MTVLSARSIGFGYRHGQPVLENIDLDVEAGEVLALCGVNGSGKTTLLRLLAGQLKPHAGQVFYNGDCLSRYRRRELAGHITLMPQSERRDVPITVREVVSLGRASVRGWWLPLNAEDNERVEWAMQLVGVASMGDRLVTELSGGEWRRVILARSLAQEASVLLLDEPTAGLDLKHQHESLAVLEQLAQDRGLAVVVSLHDLNQAALYCNRVALVDNRTILHIGHPGDVLTPSMIEQVYGVEVSVLDHPSGKGPVIVTNCGTAGAPTPYGLAIASEGGTP